MKNKIIINSNVILSGLKAKNGDLNKYIAVLYKIKDIEPEDYNK